MIKTKHYHEGQEARKSGIPYWHNPYNKDREHGKYALWAAGWADQAKYMGIENPVVVT